MIWSHTFLLLLTALCTVTSCTWLDHPTNATLQRELAERSREGLALASFARSGSDLHIRFFNGEIQTLHPLCCLASETRTISRNRIVMVDMASVQIIDPIRDPSGFVAMLPQYGGPVVEIDLRGRILARSVVRFSPSIISLSPDGEHFALMGSPLEHPDWPGGANVAAFHTEQPRNLMRVTVADRYERSERAPALDWSPRGDTILFSHQGIVSLLDVQTGHARKIADGAAAKWSPSGDWISYLTLRSEAALLNVTTGEFRQIDTGKEVGFPIEWSPDGKYLLILEEKGSHVYQGCLWVYRVADSAWVPLPDYRVGGPAWHWVQLGAFAN
jgi:hypothetical protein